MKTHLVGQLQSLSNAVPELVNFGISVRLIPLRFDVTVHQLSHSLPNKLFLTSVMLEVPSPRSNLLQFFRMRNKQPYRQSQKTCVLVHLVGRQSEKPSHSLQGNAINYCPLRLNQRTLSRVCFFVVDHP